MAQDSEFETDGVKATVLNQSGSAWNGKGYGRYPEGKPLITTMKLSFEPHTTLPWHTHPMPSSSYVLSGTLTVEDKETGRTHVVKAGEAFNESMDEVHRGYTTDEPVELLITYAGVEGQDLSEAAE